MLLSKLLYATKRTCPKNSCLGDKLGYETARNSCLGLFFPQNLPISIRVCFENLGSRMCTKLEFECHPPSGRHIYIAFIFKCSLVFNTRNFFYNQRVSHRLTVTLILPTLDFRNSSTVTNIKLCNLQFSQPLVICMFFRDFSITNTFFYRSSIVAL